MTRDWGLVPQKLRAWAFLPLITCSADKLSIRKPFFTWGISLGMHGPPALRHKCTSECTGRLTYMKSEAETQAFIYNYYF